MTAANFVFTCLTATVLLGAALAVFLKNVYHNALGLGLALFGIAGIYLFLDAEFLAVMQVIVYVGAIAVAILFAIMLSRPMALKQEAAPMPRMARAALAALGFFALLVPALLSAPWPTGATEDGRDRITSLGERLLGHDIFAFEVISLLLLIAIIGAITLSRHEDRS